MPKIYFAGLPQWLTGKESACKDTGSILGSGRSPGKENGNPLRIPMNRGA